MAEGDYRIIYCVHHSPAAVQVLAIQHRSIVYRRGRLDVLSRRAYAFFGELEEEAKH